MGSSFPRHSARVRTRPKRKKQMADCKLAKYIYIYMMHEQYNVMMHALMQ